MKKELRRYIRLEKSKRSDEELTKESEEIIRKLLSHPRVLAADSIMAYYSMPDEVCTHRLVDELVSMGKTVFLPKVVSDTEMTIHRYSSSCDLAPGSYGIMEPVTTAIDVNDLPSSFVCITPGMAFDAHGNRLGRGKGYYDRFFNAVTGLSRNIYIIGVCFSFQFVDNVPTEPTDVRMDEVIKE